MKVVRVLGVVAFVVAVLAGSAAAAAATPESVKAIFDGWAVGIMLLWGVAQKYYPPLSKIANATIGWINTLGYIVAKLATGTAFAGAFDAVPDAVGVVLSGMTNAGWAMVLYETLGRTFLERLLRLKKAVPKPAAA